MEVPAETVDGMSVVAVRAAAGRAVAHARAGGGPYFLEAITYRYVGHSRSDPGAYRPAGELDAWKERDPIPRLRGELVDAGVDPKAVDAIDGEIETMLEEMTRKGLDGPVPGAPADPGVQRVTPNVLPMPRLSDSMSEATIVGWLKQLGEPFARGEPLVEVETDKATIVYEAEVGRGAGGDPGARGRDRIARRADRPARRGGRCRGDTAALLPEETMRRRRAKPRRPRAVPRPPALPSSERPEPGAIQPRTIDFRTAIREALDEELAADDRVIFFGEDVALAGGVFAVTPGLYEKYGRERVFDTPISELALAGAAFGSAISGLRPVVEIMFGDFLTLVMDSIVNQSTKYWFLSGEQVSVPIVFRSVVGAGGRFGAIHSQMPVSWFMGIPGLKIVTPATPSDAKGLLRSAIRDDNPVLFFEHKRLYGISGDVDGELVPIGVARIAREGTDLTIVSAMNGVHEALKAADLLDADGISSRSSI